MKRSKRFSASIAIILSAFCLFSLNGCGSTSSVTTTTTTSTSTSQTSTSVSTTSTVSSTSTSGSTSTSSTTTTTVLTITGTPDATFGNNGLVTVESTDLGCAIKTDSEGKIIVLGSYMGSLNLYRFTDLGALDSTFGTAGISIISGLYIGGPLSNNNFALDNNNESYIVGDNMTFGLTIGKIKADGSGLDSNFGDAGILTGFLASTSLGRGIIASDNNILFTGRIPNPDSMSPALTIVGKRTLNGIAASDFGDQGLASIENAGGIGTALTKDQGGNIYVLSDDGMGNSFVNKFSSLGVSDETFGDNGRITISGFQATTIKYSASSNAILLLIHGSSVMLDKYSTSGQPIAFISVSAMISSAGLSANYVNDFAVDAQNRLIFVAFDNMSSPSLVFRTSEDNQTIDASFGNNGFIQLGTDTNTKALAITLDAQGKILVAGTAKPDPSAFGPSLAIWRFR